MRTLFTLLNFTLNALLMLLLLAAPSQGAIPRDALPLDAAQWPANYRLHVEFSHPQGGSVRLNQRITVPLKDGAVHDIAVEQPESGAPVLRVWSGEKLVRGPEELPGLASRGAADYPEAKLDFAGDFTLFARFQTRGGGTLFSKCPPQGQWAPDAKALFIRDGRLVYDIGWLGAISGGPRVNDGKPHVAMLALRGSHARLWLDGKVIAENRNFTRPDGKDHILKVGRASTNFAGDFTGGKIEELQIWRGAMEEAKLTKLAREGGAGQAKPDFAYQPGDADVKPMIEPAPGVTVKTSWVQPLERADHAQLIRNWNDKTLAEGQRIYSALCVVCHGTKDQPGSLPTALRFTEGPFKNGADPYSLYLTLTKGFGQMVPQGQYTTEEKYSVIQYIRQTFLKPHNPTQFTELTPEYLASLPKAMARGQAERQDRTPPPYQRMDFGPALFWTLQVAPGNIAYKAIAIRLDDGPGGVSKGRAWMIYDHDTMRVAAATTGDFVDWKGIAFDGSHGTHTGLTGDSHFINPVGPGWAGGDGQWDDVRLRGRDQLPYGPLPREWAHYKGLYLHGSKAVIAMTVGAASVLESPGWLDYGTTPVFTRTINVGDSARPLTLRVAPETVRVALTGDGQLKKEGGFWIAQLPGGARTRLFISRADQPTLDALAKSISAPLDLEPLTRGGPPRWPGVITTDIQPGVETDPFIADTLTLPLDNPWQSWMRPGGFDFTPDGKGAILSTWNGDLWRVDGLAAPAPGPLRWRRIATGLFQPLGVKFRNGELFVTCRDQLARLRDLNGDGEFDFIENFNNDHQVTEHFHEFAMGLQTDAAGNFYYAKSARHALKAVVPHHGTLLRISADGSRTDILANGFRAANGVCLNEDGTFFVTDQEGHWTPKNRINRVRPGGFYGNLFGFTDVTDASDSAMEPPMVWITNAKDRSPAELIWTPKDVWGPLGGSLLNLSYGTGRIFVTPHENVGEVWQGAVCELPMPAFPSGIMRGRFGADGMLYACGMFAWAGNATTPGGFHRIRPGARPAHLPVGIKSGKDSLTLTFSDPIDPASVKPQAFAMKVWSLKRSANYGSQHHGEHPLTISAASLSPNRKTITLTIPDLAPTPCYELKFKLRADAGDAAGAEFERSLHGTLHKLPAQ